MFTLYTHISITLQQEHINRFVGLSEYDISTWNQFLNVNGELGHAVFNLENSLFCVPISSFKFIQYPQ